MSHCIKYFLTLWICALSILAQGQVAVNPQSDTIRWAYGKIENKRRSEMITLSGHLISFGNNGFLWVQNGMERKYTLKVGSVKGDWRDINQPGELIYESVCQGIAGTITIFKDKRSLKIHLDFTQPNKLTPNIILDINSFQKL